MAEREKPGGGRDARGRGGDAHGGGGGGREERPEITAPRANHVLTIEERDRVANALRKVRRLSRLGARLLADLVDRCPVYGVDSSQLLTVRSVVEVGGGKYLGGQDTLNAPLLAFSVIDGVAKATHNSPPHATPPDGGQKKGQKDKKPKTAGPAEECIQELLLPVGTYDRFDGGLRAFELGDLRLAPLEVHGELQPMKLLVVTPAVVVASPEMLHRIIAAEEFKAVKAAKELKAVKAAEEFKAVKDLLTKLATSELILFDGQDAYDNVLRPMMHTLAAAVARKRGNTALVEFGQKTEAATWDVKSGGFTPQKLGSASASELRKLVDPKVSGSVFVIRPADAVNRAKVDAITFDRIVYVTERIPRVLPERLRKRLPDDLFDLTLDPLKQEPTCGAFVPTVAVPVHNPPSGQSRRRFDAMEVSHSKIGTGMNEPPRGLRPYRDACVVPVHRGLLRKAWEKWLPDWEAGTQTQFLDTAVTAGAMRQESAERWERTVQWRRVGVALSGGGACSYRFVPVLEQLRRQKVPVDVFAGLSGGALLGVFYCLRGRDGLREYVNLGSFIQALMPLASWTTQPFECTTDYFTGSGFVENLEVRLAAVTVALPDEGPPHGAVVVQGTLGEAARASGTLPPTYAATEKNGTRYTDGGACTAVPARVARDCGADVILSCNAIPGPNTCNPFPPGVYGAFLSRLLRRLPPWDRMIDFQTWRSFQWQQASRAFGEEAHVFLEFSPSEISSAEPALFILARYIVKAANTQRPMIKKKVEEFKKAWNDIG